MPSSFRNLIFASFLIFTNALPAPATTKTSAELDRRDNLTPYRPVTTTCPTTPLVRPATALNAEEATYIATRKGNADEALASWLAKQGSFQTESQPSVALVSSGGGLRALLETAGVIQGFDARDSNTSVSGIFQALTYQSGLSGE